MYASLYQFYRPDRGGIRPEEFCASYRRLVKHDFGAFDQGMYKTSLYTTAGTAEANKFDRFLVDIFVKMKIIRNVMEANILPMNFPAVGSILLEFINALSDHMGWTNMIQEHIHSSPEDRTAKSTKGNALKGFLHRPEFKTSRLGPYLGMSFGVH